MPFHGVADILSQVVEILDTGTRMAVKAVAAPYIARGNGGGVFSDKWKGLITLAAMVVAAFTAGASSALWLNVTSQLPDKIHAVETRVANMETKFADTNALVFQLVCELRQERGLEVTPECRRTVILP